MKAVQVQKAGGDFKIVTLDKPSPKENEVLIKVEACGIYQYKTNDGKPINWTM